MISSEQIRQATAEQENLRKTYGNPKITVTPVDGGGFIYSGLQVSTIEQGTQLKPNRIVNGVWDFTNEGAETPSTQSLLIVGGVGLLLLLLLKRK